MSGGSMDYLSYKVEGAAFRENTPERKAFRLHLRKVAKALHKIEWNDSGDGADGESEAIRACTGDGPVLDVAIDDAHEAAKVLRAELERACAGKRPNAKGEGPEASAACRRSLSTDGLCGKG